MARKGHKKSRTGCLECKRRHLKCNEERPACRKCQFSERTCVFETTSVRRSASSIASQPSTPDIERTNSPPETSCLENTSPGSPEIAHYESDINMDHLELLHYFQTETCKTVVRTPAHLETYRQTVVAHGFANSFLMHQILALAALHMSLEHPPRTIFYQNTARVLQSRASAGFREMLSHVDATNCVDVLLFQHLVAMQVFCNIFTSTDDDFDVFLERLVGCIRLLGCANAVILDWWDTIVSTEIGLLMMEARDSYGIDAQRSSKGECNYLKALVHSAKLDESSREVCLKTVDELQRCFDLENSLGPDASVSASMIFAWLVVASPEYTDLLERRCPEALVILAHYAILLHHRRKSWAIAGAGSRLLIHVGDYLGEGWEQWLQWPSTVIFAALDEQASPKLQIAAWTDTFVTR